ncbi:MAG: winged helix-turn-helix transcriptional regulator [Candidatus Omnitrophica bacterium]|nr:winged helix-turn-helix transcriptional regulator [Candidatus Omnitrophota bacterium]
MNSDRTMTQLASTFKALGDPTRTKIIFALSKEELCVCDIATLLKVSQSAVSHQLRILRNMELVRCRKEGKIAYYSLDDDHIKALMEEGLRHVIEK